MSTDNDSSRLADVPPSLGHLKRGGNCPWCGGVVVFRAERWALSDAPGGRTTYAVESRGDCGRCGSRITVTEQACR